MRFCNSYEKEAWGKNGKMKILIIGATGFIGRRLMERLLTKGHIISCLVRKTSNTDFLRAAGVFLETGDITDAESVNRIFQKARPQAVFHAAALVSESDENMLFKTNVEGTRNICRACLECNVKKLIYLSSVAVISGNPHVPLTDDLPYSASCTYGKAKMEAERVTMEFREKGLKVAIMRPCMVYGEGEPHLLGKILEMVKVRRLPVLNVPGMDSQLHIVYVGNVVDALELAFEKDESLNGTFMVADKEVITIRKFVEILYDSLTGTKPFIVPRWASEILLLIPVFKKKADRIFKHRVYDITRAAELLGYSPKVSTKEGLRRAVKWWMAEKKISEGSSR